MKNARKTWITLCESYGHKSKLVDNYKDVQETNTKSTRLSTVDECKQRLIQATK
ncbi:hypothetical protein PITCH_A60002 [uncultured Desulfobacterium sp.]|uniref:Uncharacterized protein n=1 Tax=uncultured Desulfobacterium sp. TaxID=201089 RepID=A0A445N174_9BACT|nr:hypothetical protein PITCH_A60002 [uncultured Desulfobacterium sp.]